MDFELPPLSASHPGWGPSPDMDVRPVVLASFDIEHLDKYPLQRLGKICDFTLAGLKFAEQRAAKGSKGKNKGFQQLMVKTKDDEGFAMVDSKPMPVKGFQKGKGGGGRGKGKGKVVQNYQEGILGAKQKVSYSDPTKGQPIKGAKGKVKGNMKGRGPNRGRGMPSFKEWSYQAKTDWNLKWEVNLAILSKAMLDSRQVKFEDVRWAGQLHDYNKDMDRIMVRTEKRLQRFEEKKFFNVSASEDPHLTEMLQSEGNVTLIATDHVLAAIVSAARSVYSWDIVVTKVKDSDGNDKLIFDKRDGASLDFLTVNETAQEPPDVENPKEMNQPAKLGQEASMINQNFSQMVLDFDTENPTPDGGEFEEHPFDEDEDGTVASGCYRYRKITLPGNPKDSDPIKQRDITMGVRTEVSCKMPGTDALVFARALNEYDPKTGLNWRRCLESQRGAVLATELKNNSFKLGRWTAQAMFAGCSQLKLGYISREDAGNPWSHGILGVQTRNTDEFAEQIGVTRNNAFGILRSVIDNVLQWDDGKYLLLKDPTKSMMRFHEIPWDTFDEDEEDDEDDDEGLDLDDEGRLVPGA